MMTEETNDSMIYTLDCHKNYIVEVQIPKYVGPDPCILREIEDLVRNREILFRDLSLESYCTQQHK